MAHLISQIRITRHTNINVMRKNDCIQGIVDAVHRILSVYKGDRGV